MVNILKQSCSGSKKIIAVKKGGWTKTGNSGGIFGPYATIENQWVGYDDVEMVQIKGEYVKSNGYGGLTFFTIDMDDFKNRCCQGTNPLLRAASRTLRGDNVDNQVGQDCNQPAEVVTPGPIKNDIWDDGSNTTPQPQNPGIWTSQAPPTTTTATTTVTVADSTTTSSEADSGASSMISSSGGVSGTV